jgi:hypothetical protein
VIKFRVHAEDIGAIFVTGGSSFVPAIKNLVKKNLAQSANPRGAGIHIGR